MPTGSMTGGSISAELPPVVEHPDVRNASVSKVAAAERRASVFMQT